MAMYCTADFSFFASIAKSMMSFSPLFNFCRSEDDWSIRAPRFEGKL